MRDLGEFIFDFILVIMSLIFAAVFKRYFSHIYKVGQENVIKSFIWGGVSAVVAVFIMLFAKSLHGKLPTGALFVFYPVFAVGFSAGAALLLGLIGLGEGNLRYLAILILGGTMTVAYQLFHYVGAIIFRAAFFYGIGATVLSFFHPIENTERTPNPSEEGNLPEAIQQKRSFLKGDITPIFPPPKHPEE